MTKRRVVVGDDHLVIVEALKSVIEPEFDVAAVASNGEQVISETDRLQPDAVLLDINMPVIGGFAAAREIKARQPSVKILFLTQSAEKSSVDAAFDSGASAYVLKASAGSQLLPALRDALDGKTYLSPQLREKCASAMERAVSGPEAEPLSPRELQLLRLLAEGKNGTELAGLMKVSIRTAEFLVLRLMEQLGVADRRGLADYAARHGN